MSDRNKLVRPFADDEDPEVRLEAPQSVPDFTDYVYPETEEGSQLRTYWREVRKRIWLVILTVVATAMLTTVYMARKPDIYEARAQVQIDLENNSAFGAARSGAVVLGGSNDPAYFNTQLRVLTSSELLGRVVRTLDLDRNQAYRRQNQSADGTWQRVLRMVGLGDKEDSKQKKQEDKTDAPAEVLLTSAIAPTTSSTNLQEAERLAPYIESIRRNLNVDPVKESRLPSKETRLIEIRFTHTDPQIAAKIVNTLVELFSLTSLEKATEKNTSAADFLQKRVADLQAQIRAGKEQLTNYSAGDQMLSLEPNQNTVAERLMAINRELLEAENNRKEAEAAYNARLAPGAAEAQAEEARQSLDAESKIALLQQKRAELLIEDTEESPLVVAVDKQIAVLEQQATSARQRAASNVVKNLETRLRETQARENALSQAFEEQSKLTLAQNKAAINYRIMQQEVKTQEDLLNGLLQRQKENDIVLASLVGTPNNIHVLDYALVPKGPVGPRRWLAVSMLSGLALIVSVVFSIFLGSLDDTVHSTEEAERTLRLPVLALVPTIGGLAPRRLLPAFSKAQRLRNRRGETPLVTDDVRSPLAEAYRSLRTSILLSTAGRPPKTLLVTSSLPAEGKTTTAVNMALTLASPGDKVLIIDADMHRPSLQAVFRTDNHSGLSTFLVKDVDDEELLASMKQYEDTSLHVLTTGPLPPNPAELLGSQQMRDLMAKLEKSFDYIVIDSPPITFFTDSVLLTSVVDGVLLVVNSGSTSRHIVQRSRKILRDVNARIFGVVLNNVDVNLQEYSY